MMKSEEKLSHDADRERERRTIVKYAVSVLHSKGLLSKGKDFTRALYYLVRRHLFHSNPYDLVVPPKSEKNLVKVTVVKVTAQAHRRRSTYITEYIPPIPYCKTNRALVK